MSIDYTQRIPNNVDLSSDRRLQRALENWQPRFLDWWKDMGPHDFAGRDVYLRTAVGVDARNRPEDLADVPRLVGELRGGGIGCEVVFLRAENEVLLKRFSETRRRHPL